MCVVSPGPCPRANTRGQGASCRRRGSHRSALGGRPPLWRMPSRHGRQIRESDLVVPCRPQEDRRPAAQHCTTARLRQAKAEHETWVEHALADVPAPIRVQFDSDDPVRLGLMKTGSDVRDAVQGAHRFVLGDLDEDSAATATSTARQRSCRAPGTGARSAAR